MTRQVLDEERRRGGMSRADHERRTRSGRRTRPTRGRRPPSARLAAGEEEVVEQVDEDAPALRFMGRLVAEEQCLACHAGQGAKVGDVRGRDLDRRAVARVLRGRRRAGRAGRDRPRRRLGARARRHRRRRGARVTAQARARARARGARGARAGARARAAARGARAARGRRRPRPQQPPLAHPRQRRARARARRPGGRAPRRTSRTSGKRRSGRASLTQQLLAFGRKQVLSLEPVDPSDAVEGVLPMLRRLVGTEVELVTELGPGLPAVRADRAQLGAALLNLAANARDAMPSGGVLRVATALAAVDAERAARRPDRAGPLRRDHRRPTPAPGWTRRPARGCSSPSSRRSRPGNGLGLATAHGTVRQLGGAIEVESAPGLGAIFRVLLPESGGGRRPDAARRSRRAPRRAGPRRSCSRRTSRRCGVTSASVLTGLGYRVLAAASGDEAVALAQGAAIHALVSDLRMPRMDGRELRERLCARRAPGSPPCSSPASRATRSAPTTRCPTGRVLVQKPFTPADLGVALRRVLDARRRPPGQPGPSAASRSCADSHSA